MGPSTPISRPASARVYPTWSERPAAVCVEPSSSRPLMCTHAGEPALTVQSLFGGGKWVMTPGPPVVAQCEDCLPSTTHAPRSLYMRGLPAALYLKEDTRLVKQKTWMKGSARPTVQYLIRESAALGFDRRPLSATGVRRGREG